MRILIALCIALVAIIGTSGCRSDQGYAAGPRAKVTGRSGKCESCGDEVDLVSKDQTVDVQGIRHVVCSQSCAKKLEQDILTENQHEH